MEQFTTQHESCLIREKEVEFSLSYEKIAREHILLNCTPIFNRGAHDRIFAGMANHCCVLTDRNPYLQQQFQDRKQLMLYSLSDLKELKDVAEEMLTNLSLQKEVREHAYEEFFKHHTWEHRANCLLEEG